MNRALFTCCLTVLLTVGCKPTSGNKVSNELTTHSLPQFSAKHGLLLPEQTRHSLGIKIVEVSERKVSAELRFQLRVLNSGKTTLATGSITPEEARQIKLRQPVQTTARDGSVVTGSVSRINDQLASATGLVEMEATFDAPLVAGEFASVKAQVESNGTTVAIPRAAVLASSEGDIVYTVSGEHLVRTRVKIGLLNDEMAEITDGLYAGDQVVSQPVLSLWLTELAAVKGGQACCAKPPKGK